MKPLLLAVAIWGSLCSFASEDCGQATQAMAKGFNAKLLFHLKTKAEKSEWLTSLPLKVTLQSQSCEQGNAHPQGELAPKATIEWNGKTYSATVEAKTRYLYLGGRSFAFSYESGAMPIQVQLQPGAMAQILSSLDVQDLAPSEYSDSLPLGFVPISKIHNIPLGNATYNSELVEVWLAKVSTSIN